MPRRNDGTAIRYEFQVFDTQKGRAIVDYLDEIKEEGGSIAAFIREALFSYIERQSGQQNSVGWGSENGNHDSRQQPPPALPESPGIVQSSGISMDSPRRRPTPRKSPVAAPPSPPEELSEQDAIRLAKIMANSIKRAQPGRG